MWNSAARVSVPKTTPGAGPSSGGGGGGGVCGGGGGSTGGGGGGGGKRALSQATTPVPFARARLASYGSIIAGDRRGLSYEIVQEAAYAFAWDVDITRRTGAAYSGDDRIYDLDPELGPRSASGMHDAILISHIPPPSAIPPGVSLP